MVGTPRWDHCPLDLRPRCPLHPLPGLRRPGRAVAGAWGPLVLSPAAGTASWRAPSQAVLAQGHLALPEVAARAEPAVLGAGPSAAEEQRLLLQEALAAGLGEGRVQVVHLRLGAVTGHLQPGWAPRAAGTQRAGRRRPQPGAAHSPSLARPSPGPARRASRRRQEEPGLQRLSHLL